MTDPRIARIDAEIAAIRAADAPRWLLALAEADWEAERWLVLREKETTI